MDFLFISALLLSLLILMQVWGIHSDGFASNILHYGRITLHYMGSQSRRPRRASPPPHLSLNQLCTSTTNSYVIHHNSPWWWRQRQTPKVGNSFHIDTADRPRILHRSRYENFESYKKLPSFAVSKSSLPRSQNVAIGLHCDLVQSYGITILILSSCIFVSQVVCSLGES